MADLQATLEPLVRIRGARGAILLSGEDGVIVAEALADDVRSVGAAALVASLVDRVNALSGVLGRGNVRCLQLHAERGSILVARVPGEMLLALLTGPQTPVGLARLELLKIAERIA
jgi:predicted regulator of Ras-like GTPase activity (Roadblock/LC7/MglB family)